MDFKIFDYIFKTDDNIKINFVPISDSNQIKRIKICVDLQAAVIPIPISIRWRTNGGGIYTIWSPLAGHDRIIEPNWRKKQNVSRSASGIPLQCYMDSDGKNIITVSCSDAKTPLSIESGILEETGELEWKLILFTQKTGLIEKYETEIVINEQRIPYEDAISYSMNCCKVSDEKEDEKPADAFLPVYSTWYSYHQHITENKLLPELRKAAELGLKTVIIDDGWQTDDNGRGYSYCGKWQTAASKIPDMRDFCNKVHDLGMKVMLWFSVPFVGKYSEVYERFSDKFLDGTKNDFSVLDPRYPEVREYLISCYERAVREWDLDGLKLDFIDSFIITDESKENDDKMDTLSLEDGVCVLLRDAYKKLKSLKPDILIEFRQSYIGPVMQQYGNMLRAADCPKDAVTNRIYTVDLRMTTNKAAVHSDMLMWNYDDSVETAAEQLINVMFSVPQISMKIGELPEEHIRMLEFYLWLWEENAEILMKGQIRAKKPEANYSIVTAQRNHKLISVAYSDKVILTEQAFDSIVFINGTGSGGLYADGVLCTRAYQYTVYDCMGNPIENGTTKGDGCIKKFNVPHAGVLQLKNNILLSGRE